MAGSDKAMHSDSVRTPAASSKAKPRRLGRGLNALLSPDPVKVQAAGSAESTAPAGGTERGSGGEASGEAIRSVAVGAVDQSPFQPRRVFDDDAIAGLAASIREQGIMQPLLVRARGSRFELIAGERRLRAARVAGLAEVPVIVRDLSDRQAAEWALIENIQREDLNPVERAEACRVLRDRFGLTQAEIADRLGLDRSSVSNLMRLLDLEEEILGLLRDGSLGLGHGKALLARDAGAGRIALAQRAAREGLSVRSLEAPAPDGGAAGVSSGPSEPRSEAISDLEQRLSNYLGTKVSIHTGADSAKGRLVVKFFSLDHFDDLMRVIGFNSAD